MESPKEQYSKHTEMGNETPLLILKPCPSKIRWALFGRFFAFAIFLGGFISFSRGNSGYMSFSENTWKFIYLFLVYVYAFKIIDALGVRSFKLYSDRAEKHNIFGKRTICLKDAKMFMVLGGTGFPSGYLYVIPDGGRFYRFCKRIKYDLDLGKFRSDVSEVINSCRSIGIEFKKSSGFFREKYEQV